MSAGLAISAFMPSITSSGIFSSRRASSGVDALNSNNPFVAAMNMDIAGGQVLNAAKGVSNIAKESKNSIASGIISAEESIKNAAKSDKILRSCGKVLNFTADYINPLICATGVVKVATADDKEKAAVREGLALGTMFASEAAAKKLVGIPKFEKDKVTGKKIVIKREGLYKKNPFLKKQAEAFTDYCQTKQVFGKSLKFVPGTAKGILFALASIGGYKLGLSAADLILEEGKKSA